MSILLNENKSSKFKFVRKHPCVMLIAPSWSTFPASVTTAHVHLSDSSWWCLLQLLNLYSSVYLYIYFCEESLSKKNFVSINPCLQTFLLSHSTCPSMHTFTFSVFSCFVIIVKTHYHFILASFRPAIFCGSLCIPFLWFTVSWSYSLDHKVKSVFLSF